MDKYVGKNRQDAFPRSQPKEKKHKKDKKDKKDKPDKPIPKNLQRSIGHMSMAQYSEEWGVEQSEADINAGRFWKTNPTLPFCDLYSYWMDDVDFNVD